ncbi:MAG TPA: hypothetical protein VFV10_01140 [Gammaproteobacteria bacterium]|nr:hypothetical protein [Gammaproteobacteria bacterium]
MYRASRTVWILARLSVVGVLALGACTSSVTVESKFPTPLVEPLPVRMGVIYDDDLKNYVYAEAVPEQSKWTIALGDANIAMLRPLFSTMFSSVQEVQSVPVQGAAADQLDGVIRPTVEKFEFDVPVGERDKFVEVWIQYKLTLYKPDGSVVTEWPVSGYGKAELMRSREESVNEAAIVALRDVGAAISTKFASQPDVSYWLQERKNAAALSAASRSGI